MESSVPIPIAEIDQAHRFDPWVGEDYLRRAVPEQRQAYCCDPLWQVLGESHYGEADDQVPNLTHRVVDELAFSGYRFFDTTLSVMIQEPLDEVDRRQEWSRFAFSNFVQNVLPADDRRPSKGDWAHARKCFFSQLAVTQPTHLLVVGKEQWDNLPQEGGIKLPPVPLIDDSGVIDDLWLYAYRVREVVQFTIATWIYHPSSRGRLNVVEASLKVRSAGMHKCNIMSSISQVDGVWMLEA